MRNFISILVLSIILYSCDTKKDYTQYVDPFIGTGAHGHTYPGAQVPFGMVQLSLILVTTNPGMVAVATITPIHLLLVLAIRIYRELVFQTTEMFY